MMKLRNTLSAPHTLTVVIFVVSLLFQSLIIFTVLPPNRFFKYQAVAQQYLDNDLHPERLLDFSPLYFYFTVLVEYSFQNAYVIMLWAHILSIAMSSVLLFYLLHTFFSLFIALVGTLLFMTNHSIIVYTSTFEPEPFMIFFMLGFLVFAMKSHPLSRFASGIFLSFSVLTRSNLFPLVLITPVFFWFPKKTRSHWVKTVIYFEIPILFVVTAVILRNSSITGTFTPFSMNPGYVFFEGNNPNSTGESAIYPPLIYDSRKDFPMYSDFRHELYRLFARRITEKPLNVAQVNAYWSQKAKNFIVDHPGYSLKRILMKMTFLFHPFKRHDIAYMYTKNERLRQVIPDFPYSLIFLLALPGMIICAKMWKQRLLLYAVFFSQCGIMLLTYISERQRVAIMALFIFFACEALSWIIHKRAYLVLIGLVFCSPFLLIENDIMKDDLYILERSEPYSRLIQEAQHARKIGNLPFASTANALAYAMAPWFPDDIRLSQLRFTPHGFESQVYQAALLHSDRSPSGMFDMARLALEAGKLTDAERLLRELINGGYLFNRRFALSSQPYFYLARIHELQHNPLLAISALQQALALNPGDPWVLSHLVSLTGEPLYKTRLYRYFDAIDAEFFLGQAYLETGHAEEAVHHFSYVVEKLPEFRKGYIYLSVALGTSGRYQEAAEHYMNALKIRQDHLFKEKEIVRIFSQWAQQEADNLDALSSFSRVLQQFGQYEKALSIQQDLFEKGASRKEDLLHSIQWLENALKTYADQDM